MHFHLSLNQGFLIFHKIKTDFRECQLQMQILKAIFELLFFEGKMTMIVELN